MWKLFSFRGRVGRLGYWRIQLLAVVLFCIFWALGIFAATYVGWIGGLLFLPMIPISFALLATWFRRLHDRGKGIWWALLFLLVPLTCDGVAQSLLNQGSTSSAGASLLFSLIALGISLWAFVEVGFFRGQPGANRFGDAPAI